jgi:hypothetical protein
VMYVGYHVKGQPLGYGRIGGTVRDRASVVTTTIMHIIETVPHERRPVAIEDLLRDELADIERHIAAGREIHDD